MSTVGCLFSGNAPDTEEHVISDWLQRRFNIQDQSYRLPNDTSLDYRHARVPATNHDNGQFGQIETRISRNQFVWEEVYLWLFKIHIGLMVRNTALRADIRDPESSSIIPRRIIQNQLDIFQELYRQYFADGRFCTHCSPPGSVFVLPSLGPGHFDFVHSFTCGCIGINVGDYFLATSLWDFGMAKKYGYFDWIWNKDNYGAPPSDLNERERAAFYHHTQAVWLCTLGYWCVRWNINMYQLTAEYQPAMPAFDGEPIQRPEEPGELTHVCKTFGLRLIEFIPDGRNRFSPAENRMQGASC
jgi:hypothetical protein